MLALINASQSFTDEGFRRLSVWVKTQYGTAGTARAMPYTGISWSAEDGIIMRPLRCLKYVMDWVLSFAINRFIGYRTDTR